MKRNISVPDSIGQYRRHLVENEKAIGTVDKYIHDVEYFYRWKNDNYPATELCKETVLQYKEYLPTKYCYTTANSMLVSLNSYFRFMAESGNSKYWSKLNVKTYKMQRSSFRNGERELTKEEYYQLVKTADQMAGAKSHAMKSERKRYHRLSLLLRTLCNTGIRISELKFITVEAAATGKAVIRNKGKIREVPIPKGTREILMEYAEERNITEGSVFTTRSGHPLDRSNICREMKELADRAGVSRKKVFPHNLRHLFAETFYEMKKDICRLADILGHSSINTTRIYTAVSIEETAVYMEDLKQLLLLPQNENYVVKEKRHPGKFRMSAINSIVKLCNRRRILLR